MISFLRSAGVMAFWTFLSRILGFIRDVLIASLLGTGPMGEAFIIAFRLPNLFRRLFAEGAMNSALVPLYSKIKTQDGDIKAAEFAGQIFIIACFFMAGLTSLAMIFMPQFVIGLAPGFQGRDDMVALSTSYALITFPYLSCMVLSAVIGGVMNANSRFWAVAAAPLLLNITMISALSSPFLFDFKGDIGWLLSASVTMGGLLQLILMIFTAQRANLLPKFNGLKWHPLPHNVKLFSKLILPGILAGGIIQINMLVGTQIASTIEPGAVAYLYYADRLTQLPLGLIGVALGTAFLPLIAKELQAKNRQKANHSFSRAMEVGLVLSLPAMMGIITLAIPIINTLFQHGVFTKEDATQTALVTSFMALSIPAAILIKLTSAIFFANEDTKSPMLFSLLAVCVNIPLALLLSQFMGAAGIALAASIAAFSSLCAYGWRLYSLKMITLDQQFWRNGGKVILAGFVMMLALYILRYGIEKLFNQDFSHLSLWQQFPLLFLMISFGALLYFYLLKRLGVIAGGDVRRLFKR